jgi:hypothetical protein
LVPTFIVMAMRLEPRNISPHTVPAKTPQNPSTQNPKGRACVLPWQLKKITPQHLPNAEQAHDKKALAALSALAKRLWQLSSIRRYNATVQQLLIACSLQTPS